LSSIKTDTKRLRVFAGPNGSGKTTIIDAVRDYRIKEIPVDFGIYVNADDIARELRDNKFKFTPYSIKTTRDKFIQSILQSGLINKEFTEKQFRLSFRFSSNTVTLINKNADERLAQMLAHFLREELLSQNVKFSFETVFSHPSKLNIMKNAAANGYKVYLYFVSTESPEINIYRVSLRKEKGGHDVPPETIRKRYYRSLDLMFDAAQIAYQAFFFDNSGEEPLLFAHFKKGKAGKKEWDRINKADVPEWFIKYYSRKVKKQK
jgi:predicted ABC-type ATPase